MTDRRASFDDHLRQSRHRNPALEGSPTHIEGFPAPRRRFSRPNSIANDSSQAPPPLWVDIDNGAPHKVKGARLPTRKASDANSSDTSVSPKSSGVEVGFPETRKDSLGFLPKLSRILEGKESKGPRGRRRGSTTSSIDDCTPVRRQQRRPTGDAAIAPRAVRQKHGSLQRRAESLVNLPNSSLVSVLSGLTQQSGASSGSNSTVTQKSYDQTHVSKRRVPKERKRIQTKRAVPRTKNMDSHPSTVFQYMNSNLTSEQFLSGTPHESRPSSTSSASSTSSHSSEMDDDQSSNAGEPLMESPMTSPASARLSDATRLDSGGSIRLEHMNSHSHDIFRADSDISVRASSPESVDLSSANHHMLVEEHEEEDDDEEDENDDSEQEEEDAYSSGERDGEVNSNRHLALERAAPPRLPSASSSRHSDPHTRRLRSQERELRDHVLQSPQPHRDFHFSGGPSPGTHSAIPIYDSYSFSGASPVHAPAPLPAGWPPAPPPPLAPMGYYSPTYAPPAPYSPGSENSFAMAPHPSLASPNAVVQQPPLYAQHQPPHYQPHPTGPDLTRTTVVGYELLADKLAECSKDDTGVGAEGKVVPMYRKFEKLNHRILLHLQDEISELEEELRYLDECIAQASPRSETGHHHPASRRGENRWGGELHYRRTDLLGRIYLKLGQYNQALSSYNTMLKGLDPATAEAVQAYRTWIQRHAPIQAAEAQFLERENDLLTVTARRSASTVEGVRPYQPTLVKLSLMAVLPLMAFAIVPSLLGRLFIISLIGGAEVLVVTSTELMDLMTVREWVVCASVYFGLMSLVAGVVH